MHLVLVDGSGFIFRAFHALPQFTRSDKLPVGCVLGLTAGFQMTIDGMGFTRRLLGYVTELALPWGMLGIGVGIVMAVSLLASLWPAATVARTQPLTLLQSGRAAT